MEELKSCPFCGGEDLTICAEDKPYPDGKKAFEFEKSHHIECEGCGIRTKQYDRDGSLWEAIEAWNTRIQDAGDE